MPVITLPDRSQREFFEPIAIAAVAENIGAGLARAALAGKVNGRLVDTSFVVDHDAEVAIITDRDPEGLAVLRHSTAHLLAHAVKSLYPTAQAALGPVIEDGFYYDFSYQQPFTQEDLSRIEKKMAEIVANNFPIVREVWSRNEAIKLFTGRGESYKVEIMAAIPAGEELSLYRQGDFVDLCCGPHVPRTGLLTAFKLMKVAGAYWRGTASNEMLQRIYGTAWPDNKALTQYLQRLEEAEKRDHRKLAKKMQLFHLQEEAPGMVFWHPAGWQIYQVIKSYMQRKQREYGYQEIATPQLIDSSLWERSGHLSKFGDEMFLTESENRTYAIKPMSCPGHLQVFCQGVRSYRELPLRFAEFGNCHRNEPSGSLHGLMRVRNFVQDDGHIFCTEDQIASEVKGFIQQLLEVYGDFGFNEVQIKLSTRPEKRVGSEEVWDKAESALEQVLNETALLWTLSPGEGAFYGPKLEFILRDCLGREWQCGTMQLDFSMPERLGAQYVAQDSSKRTPVMLHRATLGTFERFIGILLEQYADRLPLWLAPLQVIVLTITENQAEFAVKVQEMLEGHEIRVTTDLRNEKISYKIREHSIKRVPYLVILGDREVATETVTLRSCVGEDLGILTLTQLASRLQVEVNSKRRVFS